MNQFRCEWSGCLAKSQYVFEATFAFTSACISYRIKECQDLLKQYEESGDPDIADHLIESLDAARRHHWEELTSQMNFTHSSQKSWALIRRIGAAQQPPKSTHPSVSTNAVAAHLIQVANASRLLMHRTTKFERQVRM